MGLIITLDLTYLCNGPVNFISYLQIKEMTHSDYDILFLTNISLVTNNPIYICASNLKQKKTKERKNVLGFFAGRLNFAP